MVLWPCSAVVIFFLFLIPVNFRRHTFFLSFVFSLLVLTPFGKDGGLEPENEGKTKSKGEAEVNKRGAPKGVHHDQLGSSRCCAESFPLPFSCH